MARYALLAAFLLSGCLEAQPAPSSDAGTAPADASAASLPCTHDEDCAALGPYGYCRTWSSGARGICVID